MVVVAVGIIIMMEVVGVLSIDSRDWQWWWLPVMVVMTQMVGGTRR